MKKKVVLGGFVVVTVALVLFRVFSSKPASAPQTGFGRWGGGGRSKGPVAVETAEIQYGQIEQRKEFTGTINASYTYVITSKVAGRLATITKRIGDKVARNEIVGSLEGIEYQQAVEEALAQTKISAASISDAQAQVAYAQNEAQRVSELVSKGISSQAELDDISNKLTTQKSRLELTLAQAAQKNIVLDQARTRLENTILKAAQPGFVATRHTDGGAQLSSNSPVLTIVGIDTVYVEIPVNERDYPLITKGQHAQVVVDALPGKKFVGVVKNMAPSFQAATRTAMVEIAVVNDSLFLKPGLFARVSVSLAKKDSAQIIPLTALITRDQKKAVFVVNDHDAYLVAVSTGIVDNDRVEIVEPKLDGLVVTLGAHLLVDSSKVILESDKNDNGDAQGKEGWSRSREGAPQGQEGVIRSRDGAPQSKDGITRSRDGAPQGKEGVTRSRDGAPQGKESVTQSTEEQPQSTSEGKGVQR